MAIAGIPYHKVLGATTNALSVVTGTIEVVYLNVTNVDATNMIYVKLYDLATAPTVGTSVPVLTIPVAKSTTLATEIAAKFVNGVAVAVTQAAADSDTTALSTAASVLNLTYTSISAFNNLV